MKIIKEIMKEEPKEGHNCPQSPLLSAPFNIFQDFPSKLVENPPKVYRFFPGLPISKLSVFLPKYS